MAIDYGTRRCGIAVTDPTQTIASALDTVPTKSIFEYLHHYTTKEEVALIIVGEPKRLNNTDSETTRMVHGFCRLLQTKFPAIPVRLFDERFTSKIASRSLLESGQSRKVRRDKGVLDRVSATILLQDYLTSIPFKE